ncbi:hypothetical protein [Chitinophaga flava]|uniref:ABC transporter ATP-binding protein n=1 Tax=Chitinophaga flava TaxID=2259036 RepID=A0A365Y2E8_9BACT|nr:hypothetical protein [Chitinophaga flava]RBL92478.1 hypothetical protein DF182_07815 [Chitinophaga flava]
MYSVSEHQLFENTAGYFEGKIILLITHRVSTIAALKVDEVFCMQQGRIVKRGSYKELCARKGYFRQLFKGQLESQDQTVTV